MKKVLFAFIVLAMLVAATPIITDAASHSSCCGPHVNVSIDSYRTQGDKFIYKLRATAAGCPVCCPAPYTFNWLGWGGASSATANPNYCYVTVLSGRSARVTVSATSANGLTGSDSITVYGEHSDW